jgi:rhodanese-related sulfurtransferase
VASGVPRRTLADLLADAEARIVRYSPAEALRASEAGALIVDIRSDSDRARDGIVPGSLHLPRTVLEWRTDPDGRWRSPHVPPPEAPIILLCDHGYSTVLAAATLVDLGYAGAGHVVGGYSAWRAAGLPTMAAPPPRAGDELAGMRPPDGMRPPEG